MTIELEFCGAAQTVTGSMHILHLPDGKVLLDSGLYQGRRSWARRMNESLCIPPKDVRTILLSHAHIDHSGKIPHLVAKGFRGKVYATEPTCDLCRVMLADSAKIQEEDARFWNERRAESPADYIQPLYTLEDAKKAEGHFSEVGYNEPLEFADGCTATYMEAGHILGSACILLEMKNGRDPVRLLYTGDLGRFELPILRDPTNPLPDVDYLITECTYGNRRHDNPTDMKGKLVRIINETRAQGGKVIIPAFSVGRTQHLAYFLHQAFAEGMLEPLPIYVDSPLSTRVTDIFQKHTECYDEEARDFWRAEGDVFGHGLVQYIDDVGESKALNHKSEPCVIVSASGMCEAGRILHHLKNNVEDERNTVVIVGFQAQQTLGRRIVERREELRIFGRLYKLRARVEKLNGFSAHADADDLARLIRPLAPKLKGAFLVHGEDSQLEAMADMLDNAGCDKVFIPRSGDKVKLK
ncbi:MAG: MBL fold metallo-hydrolase RNA specificity domain-containing protein [Planctomycetota bacterium]